MKIFGPKVKAHQCLQKLVCDFGKGLLYHLVGKIEISEMLMECLTQKLKFWNYLKVLFLVFDNVENFGDRELNRITESLRVYPYLEKVTILLQ